MFESNTCEEIQDQFSFTFLFVSRFFFNSLHKYIGIVWRQQDAPTYSALCIIEDARVLGLILT